MEAVFPLVLPHLAVTTVAFWALSARSERRGVTVPPSPPQSEPERLPRVSFVKAAIPLVPLALLFVVAPPLRLVEVPQAWLVGPAEPTNPFDSRLIGAAMVVGVVAAALADRRSALSVVGPFFQGTGYAVTHIISIIVAAACFGEGIKLLGLDRGIAGLIGAAPQVLVPTAAFVPLGFAALSGSGMATTQALFGLFSRPALDLGVLPEHVGAVVSLGAAAGRTMSPVAAVTLMCASLTATRPMDLARRVAGPLLLGIATVAVMGWLSAR